MPPQRKNKNHETSNYERATWKLNSMVLCRYLQTPGDVYYEAKIINISCDVDGQFVYKVHYQGWNARHDEKISEGDAKLRFKPYTEKAAMEAKNAIKLALQRQNGLKSHKKSLKRVSEVETERNTVSSSTDPYKKVYRTSDGSSQRDTLTSRSAAKLADTEPPCDDVGGVDSYITPQRSRKRKYSSGDMLVEYGKSKSDSANGSTSKNSDLCFKPVLLTVSLANILKLDNYMVKDQFYLPILPARVTIADIIEKYRLYLENNNEHEQNCSINSSDSINSDSNTNSSASFNSDGTSPKFSANLQFALGVRDYFDVLLKSRFLYEFERARHEKYVAEHMIQNGTEMMRMSNHYGLSHLLRLMVRLPETMTNTTSIPCTLLTVRMMKYRSDRFMTFLHEHWEEFYDGQADYKPATLQYMNLITSFRQSIKIPDSCANIVTNNIASDSGKIMEVRDAASPISNTKNHDDSSRATSSSYSVADEVVSNSSCKNIENGIFNGYNKENECDTLAL